MAENPVLSHDILKIPETLKFQEQIGLQARLLLGGEALNPDNTSLPNLDEQTLQQSAATRQETTYHYLSNASTKSRREYWQGKENNDFTRQKKVWVDKTVSDFQNGKEFFQKSGWQEAFAKVGINSQTFDSSSAQTLYSKYFEGENSQSQIFHFVSDVVRAYAVQKTENGQVVFDINYAQLKKDLPAFQWLAGMFHEDAQKIVAQLIDAEVKNILPDERQKLIEQNNQNSRLNQVNQAERKDLKYVLSGKTDEPTPVRPKPEEAVDNSPLTNDEIDLAIKYMSYNDTVPDTRENHVKFLNDSSMAKHYVRECKEMLDEYGEQTIIEKAKDGVQKLQDKLSALGLESTPFSKSTSWYIWHASKARFLAKHQSIQASLPNADKYSPFDPLLQYKSGVSPEDSQRSKEAEEEILHTQLGWEVFGNRIKGRDVLSKLDPNIPAAKLEQLRILLSETPKDMAHLLSAYKLREIGQIVSEYGRADGEKHKIPNINDAENLKAAHHYLSIVRDRNRYTSQPDASGHYKHDLGFTVPNIENGWFFLREFTEMFEERYKMPLGLYLLNGNHAVTLLKPPYQENNQWKIKVYDPFKEGEQEIVLPNAEQLKTEVDNSQYITPEAKMRDFLRLLNIFGNDLALQQIVRGEYDLSISGRPDLQQYVNVLYKEKMAILQQDGKNCVALASFMGTLLNALKQGDTDFKKDGIPQFYQDFGVRIRTFEEIMGQHT